MDVCQVGKTYLPCFLGILNMRGGLDAWGDVETGIFEDTYFIAQIILLSILVVGYRAAFAV